MSNNSITLKEVNELLQDRYPTSQDDLNRLPFAKYLQELWKTGEEYQKHGPRVLDSMNVLLGDQPGEVVKGEAARQQIWNLQDVISKIRGLVGWDERTDALFRIAALYHDIGKYIIRERHPVIGWYIMQYIDAEEREKLRKLLDNEDDFRLLMIMLRDHDQFGVLCTGEASYPILLRAASLGDSLDAKKRVVSALLLCNLADIAATFDVDGETIDKLVCDWKWFLEALEHCSENRLRLDEYVIYETSRIPRVCERIRRLLAESSRDWKDRRGELNNEQLIGDQLETVFGSENAKREFASQFTRICKLDYGKRFFAALMEYSEGPPSGKEKRKLELWSNERMKTEDVIYAVFAILKRITSAYATMVRSDNGPGNLIGVELKDLTPENAPEKTARIIDLIVTSHYPGLTWMMSDAPAWYF